MRRRGGSPLEEGHEGQRGLAPALQMLCALFPVPIVLWDGVGLVQYVNGATAELFSVPAARLQGHGITDLLALDDHQLPGTDAPAYPQPHDLHDQLALVRRPGGEVRWVRVRCAPLSGQGDEATGTLAVLLDQTAARQAEDRYRAEHDILQTLMDSMPDLIYIKDRASRFIRANRAETLHAGFGDPAELLGKTDFDFYAPEFAQRLYAEEQAAMSTGRAVVGAVEDQTARLGRPFWLQSTKVPIMRDGAVAGLVGISRDITELKMTQERLAHLALHDPLTGLPNRALFLDRLEQTIQTAQREHISFALCLLDLDRFKEVNDTLGHQRGDRLLQEVATRIHAVLRRADTAARLGGDEFAIILPGSTLDGATTTTERIRQALARPLDLDGHHPDILASIGIVQFPLHAADATTLLAHVDVAMYAAKQAGCGYAVYDPELNPNSPDHLALPHEFRAALANNELSLAYQPLVAFKEGPVHTVEALLRWRHPRFGSIPPMRILPLAERIGLLMPLFLWTLHTALRQCRVWHDDGLALCIAVNVSPLALQALDFPTRVAEALAVHGVRASSLILELTEDALLVDPEHVHAALDALHVLGVQLAIDDFGTGFSSLAYLKDLPVQMIKIDKSFVLGMAHGQRSEAIVRSVIELSHNLGLSVVAEGIEDQQTLSRLAELHCDSGQGFYMSEPMPVPELERWLETSTWAATDSHSQGGWVIG